jgi:protein O-GlcNAc transferase
MTDREALVAALLLDYTDDPASGVRAYQAAIAADIPRVAGKPDVYVNLALYLMSAGDAVGSETTLHQALAINPSHVTSLYNLGCLLHFQNRDTEAELIFRQVLALEPTHVDAMINLANTLQRLMQREEGLALMRQAAALAPSNHLPAAFELFEATYDPNSTDADIFAKAVHAANLRCKDVKMPRQPILDMAWRASDRPLKVGFVSGDLKSHPVGFFLQGWLPHVDRRRLSLHAFSTLEVDDFVSQKLRPQFESWQYIGKTNDDDALALIEKLEIDVLIDLAGHTDTNRLPLFARRAAPVQISWLGWYATTGVVNMDYFLTDRITSPESSQAHHCERLWYLPDTRLCLCEPSFAPPVAALPALQNGYLTFGSFQSLLKITDATLVLWLKVLEGLTTARLIMSCLEFGESHKLALFRERLAVAGLPAERIELRTPLSYYEYLKLYQDIDVMLDSTPFPGGTTTAEALWMGVPTITLPGNTLISRQGASLMTAAGLPDWVAESKEDYVSKAVYLSEHLDALAELRAGLREQVRTSPLFDGKRFAHRFTEAVQSAYNAKLLLQPLRDI